MADNFLKAEDQQWLDGVWEKLQVKMKAECERVGSKIPFTPKDGKYQDLDAAGGIFGWTNGFWPGILWQMYAATGDECYRQAAEGTEIRFEQALQGFDYLHHDVGFMYLLSSVANYRSTGSPEARRRGLHAASILASRYNPKAQLLRAWNAPNPTLPKGTDVSGWMIADCMMNLPLLYWAADETKDPRFIYIAASHAKTAQQYIMREDGSSNHIAAFNAATGEFESNPAGQGYAVGTSWSRGQAWMLYGFALSYRHTGHEPFLNTAKKCAHYCIANLALNDWIPLVDYRQPEEPVKLDSTAGMATACGLLEIAEHVGDLEKKLYVQSAVRILRACDARFNNWDPDVDSIVSGGTSFYHDPSGTNTDIPIIYGDYYFIEAVLRLMGKGIHLW